MLGALPRARESDKPNTLLPSVRLSVRELLCTVYSGHAHSDRVSEALSAELVAYFVRSCVASGNHGMFHTLSV